MSFLHTNGNVSPSHTFTLASRASQLAQIQTNIVRDALQAAHPSKSFSTSFMTTEGDKNQSQALYLLGGKALWTKELEVALKENAVDMLVHSLKDVPTSLPEGCEIGAILEREDPVDSLVVKEGLSYKTLDDLPVGSVVGTSSVRRVAQLRKAFPGLEFADVRGNLNTRLAKLDSPTGVYSAIILAKAGLVRLGMGNRVTSDITAPVLYHAVGQGALGVEIRSDDAVAKELCKALTHWQTEWMCRAERAMLRVLEGGCSVPVGVHTEIKPLNASAVGPTRSRLTITGSVTAITGQTHVVHELVEDVSNVHDVDVVGEKLAKILMENGAKAILDDINADRESRKGVDKTQAEVKVVEDTMHAVAQ
ncbi:porphobilinogen deaminase [Rickenella mellea]|uniref:Porphobilinogen deaminase n=1 Tax=Rickenella mellea TaxID=50990 RepID=A0A4Y7QMT1_9AGAM|nr:porphobilinogen deaminase [Rickenella mellea]